MTSSIRVVKKEIRILGLDLCNRNRIVGAVLRGGMLLDGVLKFPANIEPGSVEIAKWITETRYYPELRAVMLHDPRRTLKGGVLEKTVRLPLIQVLPGRTAGKGFRRLQVGKKVLRVRSSLPDETLKRIFSLTWTLGGLPEPVRVAHLLSSTSVPRRPSLGGKH